MSAFVESSVSCAALYSMISSSDDRSSASRLEGSTGGYASGGHRFKALIVCFWQDAGMAWVRRSLALGLGRLFASATRQETSLEMRFLIMRGCDKFRVLEDDL